MTTLINNNGEQSGLELWFLRIAPALGIDLSDWERQYQFDPPRKWRFDFARLDVQVAIEIDGGTEHVGRSRHTSPQGFQKDRWKINRATAAGWAVLAFTKFDLTSDPQYVVDTINQAIDTRLQQTEGRV
jgi:very-short-patch-repair endonuclease